MAGFQIDMSPLNRSAVNVGRALVDIGQTVGSAIQQSRQRSIQEQEQGDVEAFMRQAMSGDPVAFEELMVKSPQAANQVAQYLQQQQATQQAGEEAYAGEKLKANQATVEKLYRIQTMPEQERVAAIEELVASPFDDFDEADVPFLSDRRNLQSAAVKYFGADDAKARFGGQTKLEQAKGEGLEGYSYNPTTGAYSINPELKSKLDEVKQGGTLDVKDKVTLNKEFTNLTKDTKLIRNTAADLGELAKFTDKDGNISGPSSIAMVFKFMKALDPTSVVRESEFKVAENSSGIPENLSNMYNKLWNGGKLGPKQVEEFISTAKRLSNSAIDSSTTEITGYLDTFKGDLSPNFSKSLLARIPKRFEIIGNTVESQDNTVDLSDEDLVNKYTGGQ